MPARLAVRDTTAATSSSRRRVKGVARDGSAELVEDAEAARVEGDAGADFAELGGFFEDFDVDGWWGW